MSEAERKRRLNYKKKRKGWIIAQSILIVLVALVVAASSFIYYQLNQIYYIDYTETGDVDYLVHLKDNDFYEESYLGPNQAYVSTLIDHVSATFRYKLDIDAVNIDYEYTYHIDAKLQILDDHSRTPIFAPVYTLKEEQRFSENSTKLLFIHEAIDIDYSYYNDLATQFIDTYDLDDVTSSLIVQMHVNVIGNCDEFEQNSNNEYTFALNIPLTEKTVSVEMTSSVPTGENKVLACSSGPDKNIFLITALSSGGFELLLILILVIYAYLTRNEDINYAIKVRRLLSAYRSYIQQINGEFDTTGYQLLAVNTFTEMLGIRDTIQSPILMSENEDKTRTQFIIPTNTKILYLYEIKVDDYDAIYADIPIEQQPIIIQTTEDSIAEAPVDETPVDETPVDEASVDETPVSETPVSETPVKEPSVTEAPAKQSLSSKPRTPRRQKSLISKKRTLIFSTKSTEDMKAMTIIMHKKPFADKRK